MTNAPSMTTASCGSGAAAGANATRSASQRAGSRKRSRYRCQGTRSPRRAARACARRRKSMSRRCRRNRSSGRRAVDMCRYRAAQRADACAAAVVLYHSAPMRDGAALAGGCAPPARVPRVPHRSRAIAGAKRVGHEGDEPEREAAERRRRRRCGRAACGGMSELVDGMKFAAAASVRAVAAASRVRRELAHGIAPLLASR